MKLESATKELEKSQEELKEVSRVKSELDQTIKDLKQNYENLHLSNIDNDKKVQLLEAEIKELSLKSQNSLNSKELSDKIEELKVLVKNLKEEKDKLVEEYENKLILKKCEVEGLVKQSNQYLLELETLKEKQKEVSSFDKELQETKNELLASKIKESEVSEKYFSILSNYEELKKTNDTLNEQFELKGKELELTRGSLKELQLQIEMTNDEIKEKSKQNSNLLNSIENYTIEIKKMSHEVTNREEEVKHLKEIIHRDSQLYNNHLEQMKLLESQNNDLKHQLETKSHELDHVIKSQDQTLNFKLEEEVRKYKELEFEYQNKVNHLNSLNIEISGLKNEIENLKNELTQKNHEKIESDKLIAELKNHLDESIQKEQVLGQEIQSLGRINETLLHTITNTEENFKKSIEELKSYKEEHDKFLSEYKTLKQKADHLEITLQEKEHNLQKNFEEKDHLIENLKNEMIHLQDSYDKIKSIENELKETIEEKNEKISNVQSQYQKLLEEFDNEKEKLKLNQEESNKTIESMKIEIEYSKSSISIKDQYIHELKEKIEHLEKVEEKLKTIQEEKSKQNLFVSELNSKNLNLEEKCKEFLHEKESLNQQVKILKEELKSLHEKMEEIHKSQKDENHNESKKRKYDEEQGIPVKKIKSEEEKKVIINFSGFKDGSNYSMQMKDQLTGYVKELNGFVLTDEREKYDDSITHLVSPSHVRTLKTLAAAVKKKWVVSPEWVEKCWKEKSFVDESNFGFKRNDDIFKNKKCYLTPEFKKEKNFSFFATQLIEEYGNGKIIENPNQADFVLIDKKENPQGYKVAYKWDAFVEWIYPKKK